MKIKIISGIFQTKETFYYEAFLNKYKKQGLNLNKLGEANIDITLEQLFALAKKIEYDIIVKHEDGEPTILIYDTEIENFLLQ